MEQVARRVTDPESHPVRILETIPCSRTMLLFCGRQDLIAGRWRCSEWKVSEATFAPGLTEAVCIIARCI